MPSTCVCWESFVREIISSVINDLLDRFNAFRYRRAQGRFWRADQGIAVVLLIGALLIFATSAPLALLNLVAGVVYALAMPFVALVTSYVYFDSRVRDELEPLDTPTELPAEVDLSISKG